MYAELTAAAAMPYALVFVLVILTVGYVDSQ
jgi:hypothetical protein